MLFCLPFPLFLVVAVEFVLVYEFVGGQRVPSALHFGQAELVCAAVHVARVLDVDVHPRLMSHTHTDMFKGQTPGVKGQKTGVNGQTPGVKGQKTGRG